MYGEGASDSSWAILDAAMGLLHDIHTVLNLAAQLEPALVQVGSLSNQALYLTRECWVLRQQFGYIWHGVICHHRVTCSFAGLVISLLWRIAVTLTILPLKLALWRQRN